MESLLGIAGWGVNTSTNSLLQTRAGRWLILPHTAFAAGWGSEDTAWLAVIVKAA